MITLDDWSSLVTVNYDGGLSGDFFATLLDNSLIGTKGISNFNNFDKRDRYIFTKKDAFDGRLKCMHYFFTSIKQVSEHDDFSKSLNVLYNTVYNSNKKTTSYNLRNYCFENYSHVFNRIKVVSMHYVNSGNPPLQFIFPKSKNIYIGTKNENYKLISKLLFYYKTGVEFFKIDKASGMVLVDSINKRYLPPDISVSNLLNLEYNQNHYNEFFIDIYNLIYNNYNYNEELSKLLNYSIVLNQNEIKTYRDKTLKLLDSFDIDPYYDYNYDELRFKIKNIILNMLD